MKLFVRCVTKVLDQLKSEGTWLEPPKGTSWDVPWDDEIAERVAVAYHIEKSNWESLYADISDLAYMRTVKDMLHRMNIQDVEVAPPEILEIHKRCCRDAGSLRTYFEGRVSAHSQSINENP